VLSPVGRFLEQPVTPTLWLRDVALLVADGNPPGLVPNPLPSVFPIAVLGSKLVPAGVFLCFNSFRVVKFGDDPRTQPILCRSLTSHLRSLRGVLFSNGRRLCSQARSLGQTTSRIPYAPRLLSFLLRLMQLWILMLPPMLLLIPPMLDLKNLPASRASRE